VLELIVTAMVAGGDGLARHPDGRVVFVEGGLPGERVGVSVTEERRDFLRATVVDVVDASADRLTPPCPERARGCGGCPWQHIAVGAQPRLKAGIVQDALRRLAHIEPAVTVGPTAVAAAYRTTVRLAVDRAGRPSYRPRRGHDNIAVDTCLVAHPRLEDLIVSSRFLGGRDVVLRVGAATGERLAWPRPRVQRAEVAADVQVVRGRGGHIHDVVAGRTWRISAGSFFQAGPAAAEALIAGVARSVGSAPAVHLVDAYCGVGLLGGALAASRPGLRVTAVESDAVAGADAEANLADVDALVVKTEVARLQIRAADVVVADPARTGLGRSASRALAATGAPLLVLVSCDPASLARDAGLLRELGYGLESVEVVDLFPHTFQVETVSRFLRQS